ncbi:MAG: ABC transporter permease subunit [Anaerolineae bacterium]|jgi:ABC-type dipeptide/oligopeptide/nickel transport system permease subunit
MTQMESTPQEAERLLRDFAVREHRSLWSDAWRRLLASPTGRIGLAVVGFFVIATLLTHFFWDYDPRTDLDYSLKLKPPNLRPTEEVPSIHPFGTDKLGRDVFRRVAHGGWNSLRVGLVAVGISLAVGGLLGLVAGFYETMPLGPSGRILLYGGIGLALGSIVAWIAGQWVEVILFTVLGGLAAYFEEFWAGQPQRIAIFAGAGLLVGAVPALLAGPIVAVVCGILGGLIGAILGMPLGGPMVSNVIMRAMDVILAFPGILLAIAIVAMLGPGLDKGMIAIGFVGIPVYARLVRSSVLAVMQEEYVTAGLCVGVGQGRILFRHVVPNTLSPIIVQSTMGLASAILWAGALGFLGLGAIPPEPEWGAMLGDSYRFLTTGAWWAVVFPGLAIMLSVLGFNLLGDGLRDALDPRLRA